MTARKRAYIGADFQKQLLCPCCNGSGHVLNGPWCAKVRRDAGESQRQFAFRLGYAPSYICDVEHNRRNCPQDVREAYERLAGVKVAVTHQRQAEE